MVGTGHTRVPLVKINRRRQTACVRPFCYTGREGLMRCKAVFLANDKGSLDTLKTNGLYKMQTGSFETLWPP